MLAALVAVAALLLTGVGDLALRRRRSRAARASRSTWRTATEISVVLAAVLGVVEVRRRGLGSDGVDPVLVAAPVLVVLAVVVVVLRLLPGGAATRRRRGGRTAPGCCPSWRWRGRPASPWRWRCRCRRSCWAWGSPCSPPGSSTTVAEGQERVGLARRGGRLPARGGVLRGAGPRRAGRRPGRRAGRAGAASRAGHLLRPRRAARPGATCWSSTPPGTPTWWTPTPTPASTPPPYAASPSPVDPEAPLPAIATTPARAALAADRGRHRPDRRAWAGPRWR